MSLRTKSLLVIAAIFVGLLAALYATSQLVVMAGFRRLETQEAREDMQRILSALDDEVSTIDATARDWAVWDDTYAFVEDANDSYRESTLADGSFANNDLNLMLYIQPSGHIVFAKAYDLNDGREAPVPASLLAHLSPGDPLVAHADPESRLAGILSLPEGPMLVSSQPILTSQGEGPIRGTLIFGRFLDSKQIGRLSKTTLFSLRAFPTNSADMPPELAGAAASLSQGDTPLVQPVDTKSVLGLATLRDVYGNPALVLVAEFPRSLHEQGQKTVILFAIIALLIGLAFAVAVLALLEKLVLSRLLNLSAVVAHIGKSQDLTTRVPAAGRDELARLGQSTNEMLESLRRSRLEQEQAQRELRKTNGRLTDALVKLERTPELVRQERMNALGEMASGIAHDFKNALVPISGLSELLLVQPGLLDRKETALHYLKVINDAAKDAASIVGRLREFYLTGEEAEPLEPIALNKVVEQTIALTEPKWKSQTDAAGLRVAVTADLSVIPSMRGNPAELREAITNLIFNSVDAMPRGGIITIRTRSRDGHVSLEVGDTGAGMTEEVRRRCMEPFFTTKGDRGTGLGLAMVYGVVKRHAGAVEIQSELGKGTTFILSFPVATEEQPTMNGANGSGV